MIKKMKIKNKKLVNEFVGMMVNVGGGEDGMVGLNEFKKKGV